MTSGASEVHEEATRGAIVYLEILDYLHGRLNPSFYLEIGVRHGRSLSLVRSPAIGVDPYPDIQVALGDDVRIVEMSSDEFFRQEVTGRTVPNTPGMAFIDGMHLFEFALRDFMNVERLLHPASLVVIDDIFPCHPIQAMRRRQSRVWTGDVWKILICLRRYRPDLGLLPLDARPTGLLFVTGLSPDNTILLDAYDEILEEFNGSATYSQPPQQILDRRGAHRPDREIINRFLSERRSSSEMQTRSNRRAPK